MRAAAGVVAVLAWGGLLAAMWYPLATGGPPPLGPWLGVVAVSILVGVVVPAFLMGLDNSYRPARPNVRGPFIQRMSERDK